MLFMSIIDQCLSDKTIQKSPNYLKMKYFQAFLSSYKDEVLEIHDFTAYTVIIYSIPVSQSFLACVPMSCIECEYKFGVLLYWMAWISSILIINAVQHTIYTEI